MLGLTGLNLNAVLLGLTGQQQALSLIIGLAAIWVLWVNRTLVRQANRGHGGMFALTVVSYLTFGLVALVEGWGSATLAALAEWFYRYGANVVLYTACATAGYAAVILGRRVAIRRVLSLIILIATASVFATPWLEKAYAFLSFVPGRSSGFFDDANEAGAAATFSIAVVGSFVAASGSPWKFLAVCGLGMASAFFTFSRTAWIVAGLCAAALLLRGWGLATKQRGVPKSAWWLLSVCLVIASGAYALRSLEWEPTPFQAQRIKSVKRLLVRGELEDATTGGRLSLAKEGLEMIFERPLFGWGLGELSRMPQHGLGPHNMFLKIWGEAGVAPFAFFAAFFWVYARAAWRARGTPEGWGAVMAISTYFVWSLTLHTTLDRRFMIMIIGTLGGMVNGLRLQRWRAEELRGWALESPRSSGQVLSFGVGRGRSGPARGCASPRPSGSSRR